MCWFLSMVKSQALLIVLRMSGFGKMYYILKNILFYWNGNIPLYECAVI